MKARLTILAALVLMSMHLVALPALAAPASPVEIDDAVSIDFPRSITFSAHLASSTGLERVALQYGVDKRTCDIVPARALPAISPGTSADVSWTWDMLKSGAEPPGAMLWYSWRVTDKSGHETVSEPRRVQWLDSTHKWTGISSGGLTLHSYAANPAFAHDLLASALASLAALERTTGLAPRAPVDIYVYANSREMQDALFSVPVWTGGMAYPEYNSVIIGISPDRADWGKQTLAHELTHIIVGHFAFSCVVNLPTWLNEGMAVYGQGGPDDNSLRELRAGIASNRLFSLQALGGPFPADTGEANLAYGQSYSVVSFLITRFGKDNVIKLFAQLRDGAAIEDALQRVYGFGLQGLEDAWRVSAGLKPRTAGAGHGPTPVATTASTLSVRPAGSAQLQVEAAGSGAGLSPFGLALPAAAAAMPLAYLFARRKRNHRNLF